MRANFIINIHNYEIINLYSHTNLSTLLAHFHGSYALRSYHFNIGKLKGVNYSILMKNSGL